MTFSDSSNPTIDTSQAPKAGSHVPAWHHPILSPEHGVYVVLLVSFLTGAAAAQQWTWTTTLVLISAFAGFQAEHPLVLQIRRRRSWKPRFLVWGGLYGSLALGIAIYLALKSPMLWWLYGAAIATLILDAIAVFQRQHRSIANELLTFAAVCLTAPFAYIATTGTVTAAIVGLWLLNTCFFGSAIFTVKLRKTRTAALMPGIVYHAIAILSLATLCYCNWLAPVTASAFSIALLRFCLVIGWQDWYKAAQIQYVASLETLSSILFLAITAISLLPAHLPASM
ncbi:YwiC-like family protein [Leptothoe sp. LEGE 181152]|nr:YwiC-like family protein [Leptothoe sp. LEGE 181152]